MENKHHDEISAIAVGHLCRVVHVFKDYYNLTYKDPEGWLRFNSYTQIISATNIMRITAEITIVQIWQPSLDPNPFSCILYKLSNFPTKISWSSIAFFLISAWSFTFPLCLDLLKSSSSFLLTCGESIPFSTTIMSHQINKSLRSKRRTVAKSKKTNWRRCLSKSNQGSRYQGRQESSLNERLLINQSEI